MGVRQQFPIATLQSAAPYHKKWKWTRDARNTMQYTTQKLRYISEPFQHISNITICVACRELHFVFCPYPSSRCFRDSHSIRSSNVLYQIPKYLKSICGGDSTGR